MTPRVMDSKRAPEPISLSTSAAWVPKSPATVSEPSRKSRPQAATAPIRATIWLSVRAEMKRPMAI